VLRYATARPQFVAFRYSVPDRKEPILVVTGSVTVHINEPPARTKFGEHGYWLVLALFNETKSCGFLIGYLCVFVRKKPIVVAWLTVLVPITISLQ
jgi:hypothetical protein